MADLLEARDLARAELAEAEKSYQAVSHLPEHSHARVKAEAAVCRASRKLYFAAEDLIEALEAIHG